MRRLVWLVLLLSACARDQWLVYIATDAPIPQFGDHVSVQLIDDESSEILADNLLSAGAATDWPVSFGIKAPADGRSLRVRARLVRGARFMTGSPLPTFLDSQGWLPAPREVTRVALLLRTTCFGIASERSGLTCDGLGGELVPAPLLSFGNEAALPRPGSSAWAADSPCPSISTDPLPEKERTCVAGGLFLLGDEDAAADPDERALAAAPERLVRLSPYLLDTDELTLREYKQLMALCPDLDPPTPPSADMTDLLSLCPYGGPADTEHDDLPVTCVTGVQAQRACACRGAQLPSEAQWEFAAGNRGRETPYTWGTEGSPCDNAVVARGPSSEEQPLSPDPPRTCRVLARGDTLEVGPIPPRHPNVKGSRPQDRTELGIRDMNGNVAELVFDRAALYSSDCWSPEQRILTDAWCGPPPISDAKARHVVRGAGWADAPRTARITRRRTLGRQEVSPNIGFRCAFALN